MEKSIETIWKEGFLQSDALVAPKLNDLYNQKSKHIIDKFRRMFRVNLIVIVIAACMVLIASFFLGVPYIGAFIFLLLALQVMVGRRGLNKLEKINKGMSSYQYLKSFDAWLKDVIAVYTKLNRFFYPLFFLAFTLGMWFSRFSEGVRNKIMHDPDTYLVYGIPLFYVLPVIVFALLFTFFSTRIYQFDMQTVYGHVMKKLEELIADMEELRS